MQQMVQENVVRVSQKRQAAAKRVLGSAHMAPLKVVKILFW